jgi:plastocyanin
VRRETLDRAVLPVAIPVAAIVGIVFFVFFFSRILLAVEPIFATLIALGLALNILTACALLAVLPGLRSAVVVTAVVVAAVILGGAGVLAMVVSPEARLEAAEERPEKGTEGGGTETPAPGGGASPQPPPAGGEAQCRPSGTELSIVAPPGGSTEGFAENCLAAPAGEAFTIAFDNQDQGQTHNVAIYPSPGGEPFFRGDIITGPDQASYHVDAIADPGRYHFQCDVHPTVMTGTFVVE